MQSKSKEAYQLPVVEMALAGARMPRGVISAGYNLQSEGTRSAQYLKHQIGLTFRSYHVMPSHPTAKNELKTKRKTAATIPVVVLV